MSHPRRRGWARWARQLAVPALALAVVSALPFTAGGELAATPQAWTPITPVSVTTSTNVPADKIVKGNLLAFNDFHGALDPPTGSGAAVLGTPAGGVEYLATWLKQLRAEAAAAGEQVLAVGAGDMVGATPLVSAAFHDEPTIELLNEMGLDISSVGNHEFDEGVTELLRLKNGGCHPTDGCYIDDDFPGADFEYLAANVVYKQSRRPILPPVSIKYIDGVPVGFVGMTLKGTPGIVDPSGIANVEFLDEIATANKWSKVLKAIGVKAQVLLVHEGGQQGSGADISTCANFAGPITPIVAGLRPEFGVVVSGHTHRFYSCSLPNAAGEPVVVTSAGSNGQLITDISFTLDRRSRSFAHVEARNVIVENGVRNPDGSWQMVGGAFVNNPDTKDADAKAIADAYRVAVAPLANRIIGSISAAIVRDANAAGESPLGDVIADAQLAWAASDGGQIALMNPGGIRASLPYTTPPGGSLGDVTYGAAFTVQPFNNLVVTQTLTGAQLKEVLEQQFSGYQGQTANRILQVSAGFTYSYDTTRALGDRVLNMRLNDVEIQPTSSYRVTSNNFLANGGDFFTNFTAGTDYTFAPGFDVDALVAYLADGPVDPGPADRITRLG